MVVLSEAGGTEQRPTRANIVREISRLAGTAQPDDQVVIFLAGNAVAAPAKTTAAAKRSGAVICLAGLEVHKGGTVLPPVLSNGLEHYFFPADVGQPESDRTIPRSISGAEFDAWIQPILHAGGRVWLIYDCCDGGFASPNNPSPFNSKPAAASKLSGFVATYACNPTKKRSKPGSRPVAPKRSRTVCSATRCAKSSCPLPGRLPTTS